MNRAELDESHIRCSTVVPVVCFKKRQVEALEAFHRSIMLEIKGLLSVYFKISEPSIRMVLSRSAKRTKLDESHILFSTYEAKQRHRRLSNKYVLGSTHRAILEILLPCCTQKSKLALKVEIFR